MKPYHNVFYKTYFILLFTIALFLLASNNSFALNIEKERGLVFRTSAICSIIKAKEILKLSTIQFTVNKIPEIRDMILDAKTERAECYEQAEEIINGLLIVEQNLANYEDASLVLKLQYEADLSLKSLLKLRKEVSEKLLSNMLSDIELKFEEPVESPQFYNESLETKYLIQLETTLALESERRQIFVTNQYFEPTNKQLLKSILQKSHYQLTKILLLFENWPAGNHELKRKEFFKNFNSELRYAITVSSKALLVKDEFANNNYKKFRDMLQQAIRLNLKMSEQENQAPAKSNEIYTEISVFSKTIRLLLRDL